jgi:PPOX class probable F420-dependent enzyme
MLNVEDSLLELVEGDYYATIATVLPDGSPHQTVVHIDYDGEHLLVPTADGRRKVKNVRRNPNVSVNVVDPDEPHLYISVSGEVVDVTTEGAEELATELGRHYGELAADESFMDGYSGPERVLLRIRPTGHISHLPDEQ